MPDLSAELELNRCPYCHVDTPSLKKVFQYETFSYSGKDCRRWGLYLCSRCGGLVLANSLSFGGPVLNFYPSSRSIDDSIPDQARSYLKQSLDSLHAPSGAIMLAASSVDSMLKYKGYKDGSLYVRIDKAASNHLITSEMARWAHQIRLEANEQRHSDEDLGLPNEEEAKRVVEFAFALAEFLFVLPSKVTKGLEESSLEKNKKWEK